MEIGEEAPLGVVAEAPLELVGGAGVDGVGSCCFQFWKRSRSRLMASICSSRAVVGVSLRALERK